MRKYLKNEYMDKRNKSKESGNTRQKRNLKDRLYFHCMPWLTDDPGTLVW